jgi:acetyltransferase
VFEYQVAAVRTRCRGPGACAPALCVGAPRAPGSCGRSQRHARVAAQLHPVGARCGMTGWHGSCSTTAVFMTDQSAMNIAIATPATLSQRMSEMSALLIDCVRHGASVGFLRTIDAAEAHAYWDAVGAAMDAGSRILLIAEEEGQVLGTVQLDCCLKPNGVNRAEIQKLVVHTSARRRGIAAALIAKAEDVARENGRGLLYLDTEADSPAEAFYRAQGYTCIGGLPDYACSPDGEWRANAIYYKTLFTRSAQQDSPRTAA